MSKAISRSINVSTVSAAVAIGLAAVFVGRKTKVVKPILSHLSSAHQEIQPVQFVVRSGIDLYTNDDDLGYC